MKNTPPPLSQKSATTSGCVFSAGYREDIALTDDLSIRIRIIRPADKPYFIDGFEKLSTQSRQQRCFNAKQALTPAELSYFTEVDGVDHFALGAVLLDASGREKTGAGGARFVRLASDEAVAEAALTVLDEWQGLGIGRLLLERLMAAAVTRGIKRFRCELLTENQDMRRLLQRACSEVSLTIDGAITTAEFPIVGTDASVAAVEVPATADPFEILRLTAAGALTAQNNLIWFGFSLWWHTLGQATRLPTPKSQ